MKRTSTVMVVLSLALAGYIRAEDKEACKGPIAARRQGQVGRAILRRVRHLRRDDTATALLMIRFYENLLGARKGQKPMPKAQALAEAKAWLRGLSAEEVQRLADNLPGDPRGTLRDPRQSPAPQPATHPYAHPYYWSGFILIGDPK